MLHIYRNKLKENFRILRFNLWQKLNNHYLQTYKPNDSFTRCDECGRDVHDFQVPDELWYAIEGNEAGTLCYDCFCDKTEKKLGKSWRMNLDYKWKNNSNA